MAAKKAVRCKTCGLFECAHKKVKKNMNPKFGSYYASSPGLNKLFETEAQLVGEKAARKPLRGKNGAIGSDSRTAKEMMDEFSKWLTERGWSVDIAPGINADDRRGFVISILEPTNVKVKKE